MASQYFQNMRPGDVLNFNGPFGNFVFRPGYDNYFFIATGVGLAPIISILKNRLEEPAANTAFHLLHGCRNEENLFYGGLLKDWQDEYDNFSCSFTLTRPKQDWPGLRGRVTEHLPEKSENSLFYLCGGMDMINQARDMLLNARLDAKNILFEIF